MENLVKVNLGAAYKGKKVFVTGHTGFKGSWLVAWLYQLGATVKGYALSPQNDYDLYCAIKGDQICESVIADIRDRKRLEEEIVSFQPDFVFHLAAQPLVRLSYEIPLDTFEVNVMGTANVLDAARKVNGSCQVVIITTDKVYYNKEWIYPYREEDTLGGYDPYSGSKAAAELVVASYRSSFFNPKNYDQHLKSIAVARAGNVIGGGDWSKDRIVPDIIKAIREDKEVFIRNPASVRPWQHVVEPLYGYLLLGCAMAEDPVRFAQAYNFGPNNHEVLNVQQLVNLAISTFRKGSYAVAKNEGNLHEAKLLSLDISKAISELKWVPKYSPEEAIMITINWYKKFELNNERALDYVLEDIHGYYE